MNETPIVTPKINRHRPKLVTLVILSLAFVTAFSAMFVTIANQNSLIALLKMTNEQLLSQNQTYTKDEIVTEELPEVDICSTLTSKPNSTFPDFEFSYEGCKWTYSEKSIDPNDKQFKSTEYTLIHENNILTIKARSAPTGAEPVCTSYDYTLLSNGAARIETSNAGGKTYKYEPLIYPKGSDQFAAIVEVMTEDLSQEKFCYYPAVSFGTTSSVISTGAGAPAGMPQPGNITVDLVINNPSNLAETLKLADAIVVGLKY